MFNRLLFALSKGALASCVFGFILSAVVGVTLFLKGPTDAGVIVLACGMALSALIAACVQVQASRLQMRQLLSDNAAAQKSLQEEFAFRASHDELTGLTNATMLRDRLEQAKAFSERYGHPVWVVFLGIDHFKLINDILSRKGGDTALKLFAERLLATVRDSDTVARIGGDEFVLILPQCADDNLSESMLPRIMDAIARPMTIEGHDFTFQCSIGVAVCPIDGTDQESLVACAEAAMHRVKEKGGHDFQFYSLALNRRSQDRTRLAADLRRALDRGEFMLQYQPQVDLRTGRIIGMEALVRWQHPELGLVAPDRFISVAEEVDLIGPLGAWVLRTACTQNKAWQDKGLNRLRVAVNLSARQLYDRALPALVRDILDETGLAPGDLELEITESMMMNDVERAILVLCELKAIGVQIAVDDFGTGYSSLAYLKSFPIDVLKIDRSFVRDITTDAHDAMIVTAIVALAHNLGFQVIAEGVETPAQLSYLQRQSCDNMQGFYYSPPLWVDGFEQIMRKERELTQLFDVPDIQCNHLLILDDEPRILDALQRALRHENYTILAAQTPTEAFELLALHPVQVLLCDHRMPTMTGIDFLAKVKGMYPATKRVLFTGSAELPALSDAVNHGEINRFFTKPWQDDILMHDIRDLFRQYAHAAQENMPPNEPRSPARRAQHDFVDIRSSSTTA